MLRCRHRVGLSVHSKQLVGALQQRGARIDRVVGTRLVPRKACEAVAIQKVSVVCRQWLLPEIRTMGLAHRSTVLQLAHSRLQTRRPA